MNFQAIPKLIPRGMRQSHTLGSRVWWSMCITHKQNLQDKCQCSFRQLLRQCVFNLYVLQFEKVIELYPPSSWMVCYNGANQCWSGETSYQVGNMKLVGIAFVMPVNPYRYCHCITMDLQFTTRDLLISYSLFVIRDHHSFFLLARHE